jgi:hypothetical protein
MPWRVSLVEMGSISSHFIFISTPCSVSLTGRARNAGTQGVIRQNKQAGNMAMFRNGIALQRRFLPIRARLVSRVNPFLLFHLASCHAAMMALRWK